MAGVVWALAGCAPAPVRQVPPPSAPPVRVAPEAPPVTTAPLAPAPAPAQAPVVTAPAYFPPPPEGTVPSLPPPLAPLDEAPEALAEGAVTAPPPQMQTDSGADGIDATSTPVPPLSTAPIALVLPLDSATFGRAAEAVATGFKDAAQLANTEVTIIPHGDGDVLAAFDKAVQGRASVIVGPLLRNDLRTLASSAVALPWTIALNQLDDGAPLPDRVYTLTLSIETEARQIARVMRADGVREPAIVASDSPLQRRFAASFVSEWLVDGGAPPRRFGLVRDPESLGLLRRELQQASPDAILLAAEAGDAALVKPYLPHTPVYASSQVNAPQSVEARYDLEGVRFVEVPLIADPESPAVAGVPRREWPNPTLDRLYALGFDAFQVAVAFDHGAPERLEIDGATGHLTLGHGHQILREGRIVRFESGHVVADLR